MRYKNLILIGTSHIAKQSIEEVENTIKKESPVIVALELDNLRLKSLLKKEKRKLTLKDIKRIGYKGFLFALIGSWLEHKLGRIVQTKPGDEMRKAIEIAASKNAKIALIDQNINITLRRLSKSITWKEKFNFISDLLKSLFFGRSELKKLGIKKLDLSKVPHKKLIKGLIQRLKKRYPNVYMVLIEERNWIMAKKLIKLMKLQKGKIVAIMGAGHIEEVLKIVKSNINKLDFI